MIQAVIWGKSVSATSDEQCVLVITDLCGFSFLLSSFPVWSCNNSCCRESCGLGSGKFIGTRSSQFDLSHLPHNVAYVEHPVCKVVRDSSRMRRWQHLRYDFGRLRFASGVDLLAIDIDICPLSLADISRSYQTRSTYSLSGLPTLGQSPEMADRSISLHLCPGQ